MIAILLAFWLSAPSTDASAFEGHFVLAQPGRAEAAIREAVERSVDDLFFLVRPFARSRLERSTDPCPTLDIRLASGRVSIWCERDEDRFVSSPDGRPRTMTFEGKELVLAQTVKSEVIRQRFESDEGERINHYRLEEGGRILRMDVELDSPRLPHPVSYAIRYRRASTGDQ